MASNTIHYNTTMSLTTLKAVGLGECGRTGWISPYSGMINCKECLAIAEAEKNTTAAAVKNSQK